MSKKLNYCYETLHIRELDIHIRSLKDTQEYYDKEDLALDAGITDSQWSLFGVLWPAGYVLATLMEQKNTDNLKILEVGCGLALASLVLKTLGNNITATDYNPAVEDFLKENIRINECLNIPFIRADWRDDNLNLDNDYDLIIGSDILYERDHSHDLSHFINKSAKQKCEVIIVDPKRGNQNNFTREMGKNNFIHHKDDQIQLDRHSIEFRGNVHHYNRK